MFSLFLWREIRILASVFFLKKMTSVILPKFSEYVEPGHFFFWKIWKILRRFVNSRILEFLDWRFVVGFDHELVVRKIEHLGCYNVWVIKLWRKSFTVKIL